MFSFLKFIIFILKETIYFLVTKVYKINKKTYWIECLIGNIKYLPLYQNISSLNGDNLCIAIFNNKKKVNIIDNRDGIIIKSGRINNIKLLCKFSIFLFQLLKIICHGTKFLASHQKCMHSLPMQRRHRSNFFSPTLRI